MNDKLKKKILNKIKTTEKEHESIEKSVKEFVSIFEKSAKKLGYKCKFFVGGSFGKRTYLKGNFDVDIFCSFDVSYDDSKLSGFLEDMIKDVGIKYKKQKGSRNYFSGDFKTKYSSIHFELIPNLNIKELSDAKNITDFSPFHVKFLKDKIKKNKNIIDEVILAKQFFKSKSLYGAESYIDGFSGHVIDILIAFYGSLENLLLVAKNWGEEVFVDINDFYSGSEMIEKVMTKDKISNLVVVDPILKERNAARALGKEKYEKFITIATLFEKFTIEDFQIRKENPNEVVKRFEKFAKGASLKLVIYEIGINVGNESEDIVGSKLLKLKDRIKNYFKSFDFDVFRNEFVIDFDEQICLLCFFIENPVLPRVKKVFGPQVYMKDAVKNFLEKRNGDYFIENSKVCVYEKRVISKIEQICKFSKGDFEKFSNKNLDFIDSINLKILS